MLAPEGALSRRLQLLPFVREISWSPYGSEFEASLLLYREIIDPLAANDSATVRKRLRLRAARISAHGYGERLSPPLRDQPLCPQRGGPQLRPLPTRALPNEPATHCSTSSSCAAAWKICTPFLSIPACPYFEMKKCLAPCNQTCTPDRHRAEADAVFETLRTHGRSLLSSLERERAAASEALEFEAAAAIHQRYEKAETALRELPESVRLLSELSAVIVQPSARCG